MSIVIKFRECSYTTTPETLKAKGENILSALLECPEYKTGEIFIDKDGTHFRHVLNYLSENKLPIVSSYVEKLEIEYLFLWVGFKVDLKVYQENGVKCSEYNCYLDVTMQCMKCGQYFCKHHSTIIHEYIDQDKYSLTYSKNGVYKCSGNSRNCCDYEGCIRLAVSKNKCIFHL